MELSQFQMDFYNENGYLIIEDVFRESEIERLKNATEFFESHKPLPNVICEEDGSIRSVFAPHLWNELYKDKRIVQPVHQLLDDQVYLYQYKLNNKKALKEKFWEWHQDFPYWHIDDGVEFPNMISVMMLFQGTSSYQGPLLFLPGSHHLGVANFKHKGHLENEENDIIHSLDTDLKFTIHPDLSKDYFIKGRVVEGVGSKGICIFFHPNIFHASNNNISTFDRETTIITYNSIHNLPSKELGIRPEYVCSRNYEPIGS